MNEWDDDSTCPVCGYHLHFVPWIGDSPSDEICPCCGTQFGLDDSQAFRDPDALGLIHERLREQWVARGMPWSYPRQPPPGWDPVRQLADLAAGTSDPTAGGRSATASDPMFDGSSTCAVCGYQLDFVAWIGPSPSHRTCPSCGTRFGFHDMLAGGDPGALAAEHRRLRERWLRKGAPWSSASLPPPPHWDQERQLLNLNDT